jgi:hypothetical protein
MLASMVFQASPLPSLFLKTVVEMALKGEPIKEALVGYAIYGNGYETNSSNVRVTAGNTRFVIRRYYETEGSADEVIIRIPEPRKTGEPRLPPGTAYRPMSRFTSTWTNRLS